MNELEANTALPGGDAVGVSLVGGQLEVVGRLKDLRIPPHGVRERVLGEVGAHGSGIIELAVRVARVRRLLVQCQRLLLVESRGFASELVKESQLHHRVRATEFHRALVQLDGRLHIYRDPAFTVLIRLSQLKSRSRIIVFHSAPHPREGFFGVLRERREARACRALRDDVFSLKMLIRHRLRAGGHGVNLQTVVETEAVLLRATLAVGKGRRTSPAAAASPATTPSMDSTLKSPPPMHSAPYSRRSTGTGPAS